MLMSGALVVGGSGCAASMFPVAAAVRISTLGPLKKYMTKAITVTPPPAAMAHFGIGDFDFLEEAALSAVEVFLCGAVACGVVT